MSERTNYIDLIADQISAYADPSDPVLSDRYRPLFRIYALLALSKGLATTLRDVHDAWSVWCAADFPGHRSLIPFDDLSHDVQRLDEPYTVAIHRVAAELMGLPISIADHTEVQR